MCAESMFKTFEEHDFAFRNSKGKVKEPPVFDEPPRIVDAHCHLSMLTDPAYALANGAYRGVAFIENITNPADDAREAYERIDDWVDNAQAYLDLAGNRAVLPTVRFACGLHPHDAKSWDEVHDELLAYLKDPRTSCIGEIGLDYHYDYSPRDVQRDIFARQLNLAQEMDLPVELHIREAHDDALEILRREGCPAAGTVLHCFNLDAQTLQPFLDLGCMITLGGPLTFKGSAQTRAAIVDVGPTLIMTETDAPFMAPEPLRGVECGSEMVAFTLRMLLDCFGYAGQERAEALVTPRASEVPEGTEPAPLVIPDFSEIHERYDEHAFCKQLYDNAIALLGRANPNAEEE